MSAFYGVPEGDGKVNATDMTPTPRIAPKDDAQFLMNPNPPHREWGISAHAGCRCKRGKASSVFVRDDEAAARLRGAQ